jgi:hypothetical protein
VGGDRDGKGAGCDLWVADKLLGASWLVLSLQLVDCVEGLISPLLPSLG